jgi:hypothetical protein
MVWEMAVNSAMVAIAAIRTVERDVTRRDDATPRRQTSLAGMVLFANVKGSPIR